MAKNYIFLGAPGTGKGTQAAKLSEEMSIKHLSTGEMLREAVAAGTELGKKADAYMSKGELVPDDLLVGLIEDQINSGALDSGFILDGFPRTMPQTEALQEMLEKKNIEIDAAVLFTLPDDVIVERLAGRGRADDDESVVRNRLEVYRKQTQPIEAFYRKQGNLVEVSAAKDIDGVYADLKKVLGLA
jgi:adenylate kinase